MSQVADRTALTAAFEALKSRAGFDTAGLGQLREAAFERFEAQGFPTTRNEEWRPTNVNPIATTQFSLPSAFELPRATAEPFLFADEIPHRVVLVNGRWSQALSSIDALPAGVTVRSFSDKVATLTPKTAPEWLVRASAGMPFINLNTAFVEDGVVIDIAPKAVVADPIHIVCINTQAAVATMVTPRVQIKAGAQAQAYFVESYVSLSGAATFTNAVTIVDVAEGAMVDHVKLQREALTAYHLAAMFARVD